MVSWSVDNLIRRTSDGGVVVVRWSVSLVGHVDAHGETHTIPLKKSGECKFEPDPSSDGFIAYENLTEDNVLSWVFSIVDRQSVEDEMAARLDAKRNSIMQFDSGVPWSNA